jgi:hypothetical protein
MRITTIQEIIKNIDEFGEDSTLFAKKIDGEFKSNSEFVVLELSENELAMKTTDIAKRHCPGFEYFLEVFLIKEILEDVSSETDFNKKVEIIVHYAEFDC